MNGGALTPRAFLSSTYEDLKEHRAHVISALRRAGFTVDPMEEWPADPSEPKDFSQDRLEGCDLCVLLVAWRRGFVPDRTQRSITQLEYDEARRRGIDVLAFMLDEEALWPRKFDELDSDPDMRPWRTTLTDAHGVEFFGHDVESLSIEGALTRWVASRRAAAPAGDGADETRRLRRTNVPCDEDWMVARAGAVEQILAELTKPDARLVSLVGPGGVGKTVLAEQACCHPTVVESFPGGVWKVVLGTDPDVDALAEDLYQLASGRPPGDRESTLMALGDVFGTEPTLVLLDDVWPPSVPTDVLSPVLDAADLLIDALPPNVVILVTTRGAALRGADRVTVGQLDPQEARRVLLRDAVSRSGDDALAAADELADLLGRWALLVDIAASLLAGSSSADDNASEDAIRMIIEDFRADPTVLEDPASRDRSFSRLVQRSVLSLADADRTRFEQLSVFPADAELPIDVLADLWSCRRTEALLTKRKLEQVGLARGLTNPERLTLHDLIVAELHAQHPPGSKPDWHLRSVERAIGPDGEPHEVTDSRARWMAYHVVEAGAWHLLDRLTTLEWREAFLSATGSDAAYLAALDLLATAAADRPQPDTSRVFEVVLFGARVRDLAGQLPPDALVAQGLLGSPTAALSQAAQRQEDAVRTMVRILETHLGDPSFVELVDQALELGPDISPRYAGWDEFADLIGEIAGLAVSTDPVVRDELFDRFEALAEGVAEVDDRLALMLELADALVPVDGARARTLYAKVFGELDHVAGESADADWSDADLFELHLEVASKVAPNDEGFAQEVLRRGFDEAGIDEDPGHLVFDDLGDVRRAVDLTERLVDDRFGVEALSFVVARLVTMSGGDEAGIHQAIDLIGRIEDPDRRARETATVARLVLEARDDPRATAAAQTITRGIEDEPWVGGVQTTIAGRLAAHATDEMEASRIRAFVDGAPSHRRIDLLFSIGRQWGGTDEGLAALRLADAAGDGTGADASGRVRAEDDQRGPLDAGFAVQLASSGQDEDLRRAIEIADEIEDADLASETRAKIVLEAASVGRSDAVELIAGLSSPASEPDPGTTTPRTFGRLLEVLVQSRDFDTRRAGLVLDALGSVHDFNRDAIVDRIAACLAVTGDELVEQLRRFAERAASADQLRDEPEPWPDQRHETTGRVHVASAIAQELNVSRGGFFFDTAVVRVTRQALSIVTEDPQRVRRISDLAELIGEPHERAGLLAEVAESCMAIDRELSHELFQRASGYALASSATNPLGSPHQPLDLIPVAPPPWDRGGFEPGVVEGAALVGQGAVAAVARCAVAIDAAEADQLIEHARRMASQPDLGFPELVGLADALVTVDPAVTEDLLDRAQQAMPPWTLHAVDALTAVAEIRSLLAPDRAAVVAIVAELTASVEDYERSTALQTIARRLIRAGGGSPHAVDRAMIVADSVESWQRDEVVTAAAHELVVATSSDRDALGRALDLVEGIDSSVVSGRVATVALLVAALADDDRSLVQRVSVLAGKIDHSEGAGLMAGMAGLAGSSSSWKASVPWRRLPLEAVVLAASEFAVAGTHHHPAVADAAAEATVRALVGAEVSVPDVGPA